MLEKIIYFKTPLTKEQQKHKVTLQKSKIYSIFDI